MIASSCPMAAASETCGAPAGVVAAIFRRWSTPLARAVSVSG